MLNDDGSPILKWGRTACARGPRAHAVRPYDRLAPNPDSTSGRDRVRFFGIALADVERVAGDEGHGFDAEAGPVGRRQDLLGLLPVGQTLSRGAAELFGVSGHGIGEFAVGRAAAVGVVPGEIHRCSPAFVGRLPPRVSESQVYRTNVLIASQRDQLI